MKIICCKCKKEYDLGDNIFGYNKANRPILICPHCGFKHIINFMPIEEEIKVKKIKKLNLGGGPYFVTLGASRFANASRVDQSGEDDGNIPSLGWNVSTAEYADKFKLVSSQDNNPVDVTFSTDGTKMYIFGYQTTKVFQYTLTTAWDVSTASYASKYKLVNDQDSFPRGIAFSSDGTKMYVVTVGNDRVYQYTLTTAWDVSTASYAGKSKLVSGEDGNTQRLTFNSDGSKMYTMGITDGKVFQYNLSTNWDVSTASYASKFKLIGEDEDPYGIAFNSDGTKLYVVGIQNDKVYQYTLTTAWDVSTASYASKFKLVSSEDQTPYGLAFSADGTKMYIMGYINKKVFQYSLISPDWDKADDFILATRFYGSKGSYIRAYKLRWRKVGGTFADVLNTGAITYNATTDLVDGNTLIVGEKLCDEQVDYTWQDGLESEGDNISPDSGTHTLPDEYYTEFQWALSCDDAEGGATYEFELWDVTEGASIGTCLATIKMATQAVSNATGKASITSSIISILSRGKIENATGKASINSNITVKLIRIINRAGEASITSSFIAILKSGEIKNATGKADITTLLSVILSRGKIENATAKSDVITNIDAILSRGKIEDATGKANVTTLMQAILSNYINASGKASIDTNIDITLARGKIENATGLAAISSSMISILSRGKIENATGKSSVTSNFESILSRGKIENTIGKASISSSIITILSKGKIENATGKADIGTSVIIILSRGAIKNATGKAEISTNIDSKIRIIRRATAKSSMISLIDIALSRGKIEDATGKANLNSSIIIALSRGKIESVTGKASIISEITAVLSRGQIESATGKAEINTIVDIILNRGAVENTSGKANIISNLTAILQKEAAINASGKASIITNIEARINRIIARAGKASLETSYNAILSKGKVKNINGKAFIYTSINATLSRIKRATGKASINSFVNIPLRRLINASGKSIFDTLIEIEITREYAFCQATLGITTNDTRLLVKKTETKLNITEIDNNLIIER